MSRPVTLPQPATAAGRDLWDRFYADAADGILPDILAIEREAAEIGMLRQLERQMADEGSKTVVLGPDPVQQYLASPEAVEELAAALVNTDPDFWAEEVHDDVRHGMSWSRSILQALRAARQEKGANQ